MRRADLITKAVAAGCKVTTDKNGTLIRKGSTAVRLWPDGENLRADVRLDLCRPMTVTQVAKHFGF